jgi:VWFA-related protein
MTSMTRVLGATGVAAALVASLSGQSQDGKPQQPPVFRSGAHYVRVDAYPARDGRPILGLTSADFEVLEDGKPQTIEAVNFIEHPAWTPLGERRDPNSQRDGFELVKDPSYRVFVLYLDAFHVDVAGSHRLRVPLGELLNRMLGPKDLFGVLTPAQLPKDLLIGQLTQTIEEQLAKHWTWGLADRIAPLPGEAEFEMTFPDGKRVVDLKRLDKVYSDLEGLVGLLGDLREERKNIVFFSDALPSPGTRVSSLASDPDRRGGEPPPIGVTTEGKVTMGSRAGEPDRMRLQAERQRLLSMDFSQRFRDLLRNAREANVSFYTIRPGGLSVNSSMMREDISNLQVLAEQTDGIAVLQSNDLRAGLGKVADDLSSHYVLGYYTSNTRWDGRPRKLTVRLKPSGQAVRARREYRAPTEAEMAALRDVRTAASSGPAGPSSTDTALSSLSRLSPSARLHTYGAHVAEGEVAVVAEIAATEIEAGHWKQGADVQITLTPKGGQAIAAAGRIEPGTRGTMVRVPVTADTGPWQAIVRLRGENNASESGTLSIARAGGDVLGRPIVYRATSAASAALRPAAAFWFRRTERLRVEWPVRQAVASQQARLLDRNGKPLAVPMTVVTREAGGATSLTTDLSLAPLGAGDYLIEIAVKAGDTTEQQLVAFRVSMAR